MDSEIRKEAQVHAAVTGFRKDQRDVVEAFQPQETLDANDLLFNGYKDDVATESVGDLDKIQGPTCEERDLQ